MHNSLMADGEVAGWCHRGECQQSLGSRRLGLCARHCQIVNIFHLLGRGRFFISQNSSGNVHQILLSRYFREELKQRIWGRPFPVRPHEVLFHHYPCD